MAEDKERNLVSDNEKEMPETVEENSSNPVMEQIKLTALAVQKKTEIDKIQDKRKRAGIRWTSKQAKMLEAMLGGELKPERLAEISGLTIGNVYRLLKKNEFNEYLTIKTLEKEDFYRAEMYRLVRAVIENKIEEKGGVKSEKDILDCIAEMRQLQKQAPVNVNIDNRSLDINIDLSPEEIDKLVNEIVKIDVIRK
ncbi:MAG: hypothetical protein QME51_00815 [Planctomycetota bacterium]|nr:hypothetical protein [Planctomycetota bacterium]